MHNNFRRKQISIHAPRVGSDFRPCGDQRLSGDFNPRSPRGERRISRTSARWSTNFNPRSPRGERQATARMSVRSFIFQSTLPAWGATPQVSTRLSASHDFNPRSPRGERPRRSRCSKIRSNFNPRSPRGERHTSQDFGITDMQFQSTLPAWGATEAPARLLRLRDFNPRSPRGERRIGARCRRCPSNFNPRSPRGERLSWSFSS